MRRPDTLRVQALIDSTPFDQLDGDLELTTRQAAPFCGMRPETLDKYRPDKGPALVKYGDGTRARVYYRVKDIRAWVAAYHGVRIDPRAPKDSTESEGIPARVA